jgi:hypothetical protein
MVELTEEWLKQRGFEHDPAMGWSLLLAKGCRDAEVSIHFGNYPRNGQEFALCVSGYGIIPNVQTLEDVDTLIRLLKGAPMDHPYESEFNEEVE